VINKKYEESTSINIDVLEKRIKELEIK